MDRIQGFEVPNLDCLSDNDLSNLPCILSDLGDYCYSILWAREYRRDGNIPSAIHYEKKAQRYYDSLPDWVKW